MGTYFGKMSNKIAAALWNNLDRTETIEQRENWLNDAINHPAGRLTIFWVFGFSLWRATQNPVPKGFTDEYRVVLSAIVGDQSLPGKFGRAVLTNQVDFLLAVDEVWTRQNLLPLFDPCSNEFRVVWDVLLKLPRLNLAVA